MSTVGENILLMRKQLGLTQEELAKRMGYKSKSTINKIELGINDIPQSKIAQFAEVLCTTPARLMGWDEEEKTPPTDENELTDGEKMLLDLFRQIPEEQQQVFLDMGRVYANSLKKD
jgi:transcriptional regulator with XRE-family HTH domain